MNRVQIILVKQDIDLDWTTAHLSTLESEFFSTSISEDVEMIADKFNTLSLKGFSGDNSGPY